MDISTARPKSDIYTWIYPWIYISTASLQTALSYYSGLQCEHCGLAVKPQEHLKCTSEVQSS